MQVIFEVSVEVFAQAASRGEAGQLDIAYAVEGFEPISFAGNTSLPSTFSDGGIGNPRNAIPQASSGINPSTDRYRLRRTPIPGIGERVGV
jgi:hypothetical protein